MRRGRATGALIPAVIFVAALALRLVGIGTPSLLVFDERYYVHHVCHYLAEPESECAGRHDDEVHPPLAKWLMTFSARAVGFTELGWRLPSAVAGALGVALLYVFARVTGVRAGPSALAAGLLALDPLHFVLSRVGMLDIFLTTFGTAAFLLAFLAIKGADPAEGTLPSAWVLAAAGAAGGLALATKWSGIFFVLGPATWVLARSLPQDRSVWLRYRLLSSIRRLGPRLLLCFAVVPAAIYLVTFAARLDGALLAAPWSEGSWLRAFAAEQMRMLDFHRQEVGVNPVSSPPWSWPLIKRPVTWFVRRNDVVNEVWFGGNPLVWWPALLLLASHAIRWVRGPERGRPGAVALAGFLWAYAPWFILIPPPFTWGRTLVFIFYLLPALPFLYLSVAYRLNGLRGRPAVASAALALACAAGFFAYFYPLLTARTITRADWLSRVSVFDDCERPPAAKIVMKEAVTSGSRVDLVTSTGELPNGQAPLGWCWK